MPTPKGFGGSQDDMSWVEYRDFTGGLFERESLRDVPSNGLTRLDDAFPMPTGGLVPGFVWSTEVNTTAALARALTPTSGRVLRGFDVFTNIHQSQIRTFLMVGPPSSAADGAGTNASEVWIARNGMTSFNTNFTTIHTHTIIPAALSAAGFTPTRFVQYAHSTAANQVDVQEFYNVPQTSAAADQGVFRIADATTSSSSISTANTFSYFVETHQGRLLSVAPSTDAGLTPYTFIAQQLYFTDLNNDANLDSTANRFFFAPNRPDDIACLYSRMPADLAVLKQERGWFSLQGAMSLDPVIIESQRIHSPGRRSWGVETPVGLAYLTLHEGVWAFNGGPTPSKLSSAIDGSPMVDQYAGNMGTSTSVGTVPSFLGTPVYGGSYLFTPKGYVYDFETESWSRTSPLNVFPNFYFMKYLPHTGRVYAARNTDEGGIQILSASIDDRDASRTTAYTFEVPLVNANSINTVISELEFYVETLTSACQITVDIVTPSDGAGTTIDTTNTIGPVTLGPSRHQTVRMQMVGLGQQFHNVPWYRIRPTLRSPTTVQAPTLAYMRVGLKPGSRVRVTT